MVRIDNPTTRQVAVSNLSERCSEDGIASREIRSSGILLNQITAYREHTCDVFELLMPWILLTIRPVAVIITALCSVPEPLISMESDPCQERSKSSFHFQVARILRALGAVLVPGPSPLG